MSSQAKIEALRGILQELDGKGTLAEEYIQVLIAQELNQDSKWVISSSGGAMPILDLRETTLTEVPTPEAP